GLGDGVLDAEVSDGIHEPLVELRRPNQPRPLQRPRRLLLPTASVEVVGVGAAENIVRRWVGAGGGSGGGRGDSEGEGEIGGDESLGEGRELVGRRELLLPIPAREAFGLFIYLYVFPHLSLSPLRCNPSVLARENQTATTMTVRDAIKGRHREEASGGGGGGGGGVVGTLREHDGGKEFEVDLPSFVGTTKRPLLAQITLFPYLSHDWRN
ncbi:hypothetical protein GW17_00049479, partial [Ensete ventricosum]